MKNKWFFLLLASQISFAQTPPSPSPSPRPQPQPIEYNPPVDRVFYPRTAVPYTPVKDQGNVGFCWSYSAMGMIEGEYLKRTGRVIDLSEEYIGFLHLYEQVLENATVYFQSEYKTAPTQNKKGKEKTGVGKVLAKIGTGVTNILNDIKVNIIFGVSEGAPNMILANDTARKYGVIPESVFSYKINDDKALTSVQQNVMDFVNYILRDPEKNKAYRKQNPDGSYSNEPIPEKIYRSLVDVFTLRNPTYSSVLNNLYNNGFSFYFEGRNIKATDYLKNELRYNPDDYMQVVVTIQNFGTYMAKLFSGLSRGYSAQLGVILMTGFSEAVKGEGVLKPENCGRYTPCKPQGGHAILAVNYTQDPYAKPNGVIIKNSWGLIGLDVNGKRNSNPKELGFQIITPDYLQALYKIDPRSTWFIFAHKDVLN